MKKIVVIAGFLLAVAASSWANGGENFPFHVGEKLTYQIFWGPFVAGRASLEVQGIEQVDGHDCYHLVAQARTSGLAELLFHVDSTTESWLDVNQLFTRRYRENRVEGKKARNNETVYDYDHKQAVSTNLLNGKTSVMPLDQPVQDVVSALYYVRVQQLKPSVENNFLINAGSTNYSVHVRPDLRKTLWIRPLGDVAGPAHRAETHVEHRCRQQRPHVVLDQRRQPQAAVAGLLRHENRQRQAGAVQGGVGHP